MSLRRVKLGAEAGDHAHAEAAAGPVRAGQDPDLGLGRWKDLKDQHVAEASEKGKREGMNQSLFSSLVQKCFPWKGFFLERGGEG